MQDIQTKSHTFKTLRDENFLYIDKTKHIYELAKKSGAYFLSRPRRFGKSLLVSTFVSLFSGEKKLFEGLYIYDKWDWSKQYPVVQIDLSDIGSKDAPTLEKDLDVTIEVIARSKNIELLPSSPAKKFSQLIQNIYDSQKQKVVVLIDEYDEAIRGSLDKAPEIRDALKETMREFYKALKANDQYIHFIFLTGVTRFAGLAIFSALNNIDDITLDPKYADICGYTQTELETHFAELIPELAKKYSYSIEKTLQKIKYWYNGYTWDAKTAIYNPYSTLSVFRNLKFANYWIRTGTPGFLNSLIRQKRYNEVIYRQTEPFNERQLLGVNMEKLAIPTLLFQAGYLTIKEINDDNYVLSWPNAEVRQSFSDAILEFAKDSNRVEAQVKDLAKQIDKSIQELNAPLFSKAISEVLQNVPFRLFQDREAVYHAALLLALWACCFDAWGEDPTCTGIIDIVWKVEDSLYVIIEVKHTDKIEKIDQMIALAKKQILDKKYYEKYLSDKSDVILMPIAFAKENEKDIKQLAVKCEMEKLSRKVAPPPL